MDFKHFPLSTIENSRFIRIIRIFFGVICILVSAFWLNYNLQSIKTDWTLWITILFLVGFGGFQILAGLGKTDRYIDVSDNIIRLRKNAIRPVTIIRNDEIDRIELFPLNIVFFLKHGRRIMLRFGTTFHETNEKVKDEICKFADLNSIPLEIIEEKL